MVQDQEVKVWKYTKEFKHESLGLCEEEKCLRRPILITTAGDIDHEFRAMAAVNAAITAAYRVLDEHSRVLMIANDKGLTTTCNLVHGQRIRELWRWRRRLWGKPGLTAADRLP